MSERVIGQGRSNSPFVFHDQRQGGSSRRSICFAVGVGQRRHEWQQQLQLQQRLCMLHLILQQGPKQSHGWLPRAQLSVTQAPTRWPANSQLLGRFGGTRLPASRASRECKIDTIPRTNSCRLKLCRRAIRWSDGGPPPSFQWLRIRSPWPNPHSPRCQSRPSSKTRMDRRNLKHDCV